MIAAPRDSPHVAKQHEVMWAGAVPTPWGDFGAVFSAAGLQMLSFPGEPLPASAPGGPAPTAAVALREELTQYLNGERQEFTLPLDLRGTPFQQAVWQILQQIPYGQVRSYAWVAAQLNRPSAVRAVGAANGRNPVAIVVPCHRVIGSNGTLTGYGGGIAMKERLLRLEGALLA